MKQGSCLCGDIRWSIGDRITMVVNCHCSMCRKHHGATYVTFAVAPAEDFAWDSGESNITTFQSSDEGARNYCPRCGSSVPVVAGDMAILPVGGMEDPIEHPLDAHIFVASKAPWHEITDSAAQHEAYPPEAHRAERPTETRHAETQGCIGGSCLCGKVRFEFEPPALRMLNCHCSRCRRSRSALFATQVFVPAGRFRWLSGEDVIRSFKVPDAKRFEPAFCGGCGSTVPKIFEQSDMAAIPAGSLDADPGVRPQAHIFMSSRSPYGGITDDLPQYDEYPPRP